MGPGAEAVVGRVQDALEVEARESGLTVTDRQRPYEDFSRLTMGLEDFPVLHGEVTMARGVLGVRLIAFEGDIVAAADYIAIDGPDWFESESCQEALDVIRRVLRQTAAGMGLVDAGHAPTERQIRDFTARLASIRLNGDGRGAGDAVQDPEEEEIIRSARRALGQNNIEAMRRLALLCAGKADRGYRTNAHPDFIHVTMTSKWLYSQGLHADLERLIERYHEVRQRQGNDVGQERHEDERRAAMAP